MINSLNHDIQLVKYPIITDKATRLLEKNQYSFIVELNCDKIKTKHIIEYIFDVKVIKVNSCRLPRKKKRIGKYMGFKTQYKKVIISLAKNEVINLFTKN